MKRLFLGFLVFASVLFSKNQNNIPEAQINVSSVFQNGSKKLAQISTAQNIHSVLDNYSYIVQNMAKEERICHQTYHMSLLQKKYLLSHSYKEIVNKLLACKQLSDEQIWLFWQEYKNKRYWDWSNEKVYTENDLKDGLAKRKRDREKQEQAEERRRADERNKIEHQKLLQKYDLKILQNSDYVSSYQQSREQALKQTISDGGKKYTKTHDVDVQTKAFMQTQGIDHRQFESLSGTVFSHQLFQECADHYKQAAKVVYEYGLKNSVLIPHLIEFTKAAFIGTQHEEFALAVTLSDIAEILAESSLRVCKGVIESCCDLIDIVRHPKELAKSLCLVLRFLGGSLAVYDQEGAVGISSLAACKQTFDGDLVVFNQICDASREHFTQWYQTSSNQDKVQVASKLFADAFITPIVVGKAANACGGILVKVKESVNLTKAVELAEELGLGFVEAEELLLVTEVGIQKLPASMVELETAITSLIESEVNTAIKGLELLALKDLAPFVEEFGKMGGVISFENKIFKSQFKEVLKQIEEKLKNPILEQMKKLYGKKIIDNKDVRVHLDHICNFELRLKESKKFGGYILDIKGGHLPGVCEALEKTGLVKIISKQKLKTGGIHYVMQDAFTGKPIEKTVFLEGWTEEKIAKAVWDIYLNDSDVSICDNGKFTKKGIVDGCELKMYWDSSNNNGKIIEDVITFLPIKE
jgi:hypothetical protein